MGATYEVTTPEGGMSVAAGVERWISCVPGAGYSRGILKVMGNGSDKALNSPNMRIRVVEVDTDGSTGLTATARCLSDVRITNGLPTGKYDETGTTTQIPNGNLRTLHDENYNPGEPFEIRLYNPTSGQPLQITPGKVIGVGFTPDAAGAATNTINATIQICDAP